MKKILLWPVLLLISGCANPYAQYYRGDTPEQVISKYGPRVEQEPQLRFVQNGDMHKAVDDMLEDGYVMIGYSSFTGKAADTNLAIAKGKELHAQIVQVSSKYRNTTHTVVPLTLPTTSTTYSTMNATAYGSGGYATAYGNGTSTTYGQQTTMVPVSKDIYETAATYWIKGKPLPLGVFFRKPNDDERRAFGTNRGFVAGVVVRGSPAFLADIMKGDLILKIGDVELNSDDDTQKTHQYAGQEVPVIYMHNGQQFTKLIKFGSSS